METIWIYRRDKRKFFAIRKDSPRLDWTRVLASGTVWFQASKNVCGYVAWGETKEAVCVMENQYNMKQIQALEDQIVKIRATLLTVEG